MLLQVTCASRKEETCNKNKHPQVFYRSQSAYDYLSPGHGAAINSAVDWLHMKSSSISSSVSGIGSVSGSGGSCSGSSSSIISSR